MKNLLLIIFLFYNCLLKAQPTLLWNKNYSLDSLLVDNSIFIQDLQQNIVIGASTRLMNAPNDYDPIVVSYNSNGNLIFNWTNQDTTINEYINGIQVDSAGMIYILMESYKYAQNISLTTIIKFDPITNQEVFRIDFLPTNLGSRFTISGDKLYLAQSNPINELSIINLQGGIIHSTPIPYFFRIQDILATTQSLYIIGDTLSGSNFRLKFEKFDNLGIHIDSHTSNIYNSLFRNAVVNKQDNLLYSCRTNGQAAVIFLDSNFNYNDTLIACISASEDVMFDNSGHAYFSYNDSGLTKVARIFSGNGVNSLMISFDSAYNYNSAVLSLKIDSNSNFYLFGSQDGMISTGNFSDYRISSFNDQGTLNWSYKLDNDAYDGTRQLFVNNGVVYGTGFESNGNGHKAFNIFKLGISTGMEAIPKYSLQTYPNPCLDYINVTLEKEQGKQKINIFNSVGKLMHLNYEFTDNKCIIDTRTLPSGLYFLQYELNEIFYHSKFVKL